MHDPKGIKTMSTHPSLSFKLPDAVVVSGAASGLGNDLCQLLVASGVATIGVDLAGATEELVGLQGYSHIAGDVSEEQTWDQVVAALKAGKHSSYGLVTSAAILDVGTILEFSKKDIERTFRVNVVGTALAISPAAIDDRQRRRPGGGGCHHRRQLCRAATGGLCLVQGRREATGTDRGDGPCAPGHSGQCAEPRPDDGGPVQTPPGIGRQIG